MLGEMLERELTNADKILLGLEHILGQRTMRALEKLDYEYFGTQDIASIIEERPELFERAMKEILGSAGLALLKCVRKSLVSRQSIR
jgi:hypothetical protein